ncbi:hypothetical protein [Aeromonas sp. 5HA1]|uniref:hypothetical protein n=1 Tax=Aeromonas sp. 5HA1 TaxID=2699197 RepID=UPI0023DD7BF4|nr:hypothetical protein [Aeromonas sp. 5HA1]MDF2402861.1 hypothetical protein [Aeromonas sp. 5HA1]
MNVIDFIILYAKEVSILTVAVSGSITAVLGVLTYKLKVKAENNLKLKNEAELDINLIKQFSELITIANGRSGYVLSENVIEHYLKLYPSLSDKSKEEIKAINDNLKALSIFTIPVGLASQTATVVSLTDLAVKNSILRDAAIAGIEELPIGEKLKEECLSKLRS